MRVFSFNEYLTGGGFADLKQHATENAYERVAWVYTCINRIAITGSSAPLAIYRQGPDGERNADEALRISDRKSPVWQLFEPPDPPDIVSFSDLLYRTFIHLGIDGILYWIVDLKDNIPVNIKLRAKNQIRPLFSGVRNRVLVGWEEPNPPDREQPRRYSVNQVVPVRYYNPKRPFDGLSPLSAARMSVEQELSIAGWNASFFKNGMKAPLLIQSDQRLTETQKKELRKEIVNYYSGMEGAHGALLLGGKYTVTPLSVSAKDLDFIEGKKLTREEIASLFQVPPALVGLFEYSNYANSNAQIKIFWEQTLLPRLSTILELIQVNIIDVHFPGFYLTWDKSRISGLQSDPIDAAEAVERYIRSGFHPDKIANILQMPSLRLTGEGQWTNLNTNPVASNPNNQPAEDEEPEENSIKLTDIKSLDKNTINLINSQEDLLANSLKLFFESYKTYYDDVPKASWIALWKDCINPIMEDYLVFIYNDCKRYDIDKSLNKSSFQATKRRLVQVTKLFENMIYMCDNKQVVNDFARNCNTISKLMSFTVINSIRSYLFILMGLKYICWKHRENNDLLLDGKVFDIDLSLKSADLIDSQNRFLSVVCPVDKKLNNDLTINT